MIGCLRTRVHKQPIIALNFEFETVLKFYNLEAWLTASGSIIVANITTQNMFSLNKTPQKIFLVFFCISYIICNQKGRYKKMKFYGKFDVNTPSINSLIGRKVIHRSFLINDFYRDYNNSNCTYILTFSIFSLFYCCNFIPLFVCSCSSYYL